MALIDFYDSKEKRAKLFDSADPNGNGILSLAELDKMVHDNPDGNFGDYNVKPVLMRAYKQCDKNDSGLVNRTEFKKFLVYLPVIKEIWEHFDKVDLDDDRRIDLAEFIGACEKKGKSEEEATKIFNEIDKNGGGKILFDEFYAFACAKKVEGMEDD